MHVHLDESFNAGLFAINTVTAPEIQGGACGGYADPNYSALTKPSIQAGKTLC